MVTESFLKDRIHSAKLAIAGKYREIKPTQGYNRKPLVKALQKDGFALQDIEDAISEMLISGQLITVADWYKNFGEENKGAKNEKGEKILFHKERWRDVLGKLGLCDDGLVPGEGLFEVSLASDTEIVDAGVKELWLPKALLLLNEDPDRKDAQIARLVGVHPSTLSRNVIYQAAAKLARKPSTAPYRGEVCRGDNAGSIEAFDYSNNPAEMDWD